MPARAAPALPVEEVTTTSAPTSLARASTRELARSLSEAVGLRPSSFSQSRGRPRRARRSGTEYNGVAPTARKGVPWPPGSPTGSRGR